MPLEIHRLRINFKPRPYTRSLAKNKEGNFRTSQPFIPPVKAHQKTPSPKFRFQHDLESLWWILVWILLYRVGGETAHTLMKKIFTYNDTPSEARTAFSTQDVGTLVDYIHENLKFLVPVIIGLHEVPMIPISADCAHDARSTFRKDDMEENFHYKEGVHRERQVIGVILELERLNI